MVRVVEKSWGKEIIFANEEEYCGKFLVYARKGSMSSMHFHMKKKETWYVQSGRFRYIRPDKITAEDIVQEIEEGDTVTLNPGDVHQLIALEDNCVIVEVSTKDSTSDTYRVRPGDK